MHIPKDKEGQQEPKWSAEFMVGIARRNGENHWSKELDQNSF